MSRMRLVSRKVKKARDRFKIRRSKRHEVVAAIKRIQSWYNIPFADVMFLGRHVIGL